MTNSIILTGLVVTCIYTDWTQIGTFKDNDGNKSCVLQGQIITNQNLLVEWKGKPLYFRLSEYGEGLGPIIGEKKVQVPDFTGKPVIIFTNPSTVTYEPFKK